MEVGSDHEHVVAASQFYQQNSCLGRAGQKWLTHVPAAWGCDLPVESRPPSVLLCGKRGSSHPPSAAQRSLSPGLLPVHLRTVKELRSLGGDSPKTHWMGRLGFRSEHSWPGLQERVWVRPVPF